MRDGGTRPPVLFSERLIRSRIAAIADEMSRASPAPDLALPILIGGFVFAADLLRALDERGLSLEVEFLRLRSYADARVPQSDIQVLTGPGENVRGRHVLLIDGVLDRGRTLQVARELAFQAGARTVTSAVVIDKRRDDSLLRSDFSAFKDVPNFVAGYGMDNCGTLRSLPYITAAD